MRACLGVARACLGVARACLGVARACLGVARACLGVARACLGVARACLGVARVCLGVARACLGVARACFREPRSWAVSTRKPEIPRLFKGDLNSHTRRLRTYNACARAHSVRARTYARVRTHVHGQVPDKPETVQMRAAIEQALVSPPRTRIHTRAHTHSTARPRRRGCRRRPPPPDDANGGAGCRRSLFHYCYI